MSKLVTPTAAWKRLCGIIGDPSYICRGSGWYTEELSKHKVKIIKLHRYD